MFLHDAYEDILLRKADEAPGGIAPLNYTWTAPGYDPTQYGEASPDVGAQKPVIITATKIPAPAPAPKPIQIPIFQIKPIAVPTPAVRAPAPDAWDQIMRNRAAMAQQRGSDWTRYLPWIAAALGAVALVAMMMGGKKKAAPSARRRSSARVSYARSRRR